MHAISWWTSAVALPGVLIGMGQVALGEPVQRSNWVPNVGSRTAHEQPLGDLWTFNCPAGGLVNVVVDTKDETDDGQSTIDPLLEVVDANGNPIAFADDEVACTYPPVCGFRCPGVFHLECGVGPRHSIIVRDFGTAGNGCIGGGGYELTVEVLVRGGALSERAVNLGGGPRRHVPQWAINEGKAPIGPALDDENVPNMESASK